MAGLKSGLHISITGDARALQAAFSTASAAATGFQATMARTAASMKSLALPLAGIGLISGKLAMDFDTSMAKITGLVGISADKVAGMREEVLALSGTTARAPKELGDALFYVTSAGLRGAEAMEALEFAAKGSVAGLGETAVIADALTSAMNAYSQSGMTGERATNALVAGVRVGKIEADSLAGVLGKVIPIASELGISFEDVVASLAAMSKTGIDAEIGSTSLRGIMNQLQDPTAEAARALASFGESAEGVRDKLKTQGLLEVLLGLKTGVEGAGGELSDIFGNVRALSGALSLLGDNLGANTILFADLQDNMGDVEAAMKPIMETDAFKLTQAITDLKKAGVLLGQELTPVIDGLVTSLDFISGAFSGMSDDARKAFGVGSALFVGLTLFLGMSAKLIAGIAGLKAGILGLGGPTVTGAFSALLIIVGKLLAPLLLLKELGITDIVADGDEGPGVRPGDHTTRKERKARYERQLNLPEVGDYLSATAGIETRNADITRTFYGMTAGLTGPNGVVDAIIAAGKESSRLYEESLWMPQMANGPMETYRTKWAEITETMQTSASAQSEVLQGWQTEVGSAVSGVIGLFAGSPEIIELSLGQIETDLMRQQEATVRWYDALTVLDDLGLDGLVQSLGLAGPESVHVAEQLVGNIEKAKELDTLLADTNTFGVFAGLAVGTMIAGFDPFMDQFTTLGMTFWDTLAAGFTAQQLGSPLVIGGLPVFESGGGGYPLGPNGRPDIVLQLDGTEVARVVNFENAVSPGGGGR